jgi:hypothetical protein
MSEDFAERLAAVDDAIAGAADDGTGDGYGVDGVEEGAGGDGAGEGSCVDGAGGGVGVEGGLGAGGAGTTVSESTAGGSVTAKSTAGDSVDGEPGAAAVVALEDRVAELEAAVQALRGYAGSVRAVNDRVEERADAAVATAEDCRERVAALERRVEGVNDGFGNARAEDGGPSGATRSEPSGAMRSEPSGATRRRAGERRDRRSADREAAGSAVVDSDASRTVDGARDAPDGDAVPWPPAEPRAPYGEVDADDDREQPGLLARLRDAL